MNELLMQVMPSFFAIDFGTQRVGTAVSQGTLAEPLEVVANDAKLFERLQQLFAKHKPTKIIIGLSENEMAKQTQAFATELQKMTSIPIEFYDETLSSVSVHEKLKASGKNRLNARGPIDHFAAAEFLQNYLDETILLK